MFGVFFFFFFFKATCFCLMQTMLYILSVFESVSSRYWDSGNVRSCMWFAFVLESQLLPLIWTVMSCLCTERPPSGVVSEALNRNRPRTPKLTVRSTKLYVKWNQRLFEKYQHFPWYESFCRIVSVIALNTAWKGSWKLEAGSSRHPSTPPHDAPPTQP